MGIYNTPGVYAEEIATLPPSVAEVSTAIPAFFGYTEKAPSGGVGQVSSMLEFEALFGKAKPTDFTATVGTDATTKVKSLQSVALATDAAIPDRLLSYAMGHYFQNGGGRCYVFSLGDYKKDVNKKDFTDALGRLALEDEPTLIVLTDAVLLDSGAYKEIAQAALLQCATLKDRFLILDVPNGKTDEFRNLVGANYLSYGAAYHPYLRTTLNYAYSESGVQIQDPSAQAATTTFSVSNPSAGAGVTVTFTGAKNTTPKLKIETGDAAKDVTFSITGVTLVISNAGSHTGTEVVKAWNTWKANSANSTGGFDITASGDGSAQLQQTQVDGVNLVASPDSSATRKLPELQQGETALYNQIKSAMSRQTITLPPSAAVAGVYASVDRDRGVWKAPANVSLAAVVGASEKITDENQGSLNVDPTSGKSINVIRDFTGKGTLVWGARTLAGNDNEWRYVPVRRLFITIEKNTKLASAFAVFEPNDATTWLKVRGMIESYLYSLWERGALAGSTPEAAYYVHVGLGKTMTPQDVLEGRMIVEIGVAAVRPAEFIVLRFMHKLQQA